MNAIAGMLSLMYIHLEEPDKLEQYLEKIADYGDELLNILDKVLDMSQIEQSKIHLNLQTIHIEEVPSTLETFLLRLNGSNSRLRNSSLMPIPVS